MVINTLFNNIQLFHKDIQQGLSDILIAKVNIS